MGLAVATHCAALHMVSAAGWGGMGVGAWHLRLQHPDVLTCGSGDSQREEMKAPQCLLSYSSAPARVPTPAIMASLGLSQPFLQILPLCHLHTHFLIFGNSRLSPPPLSAILDWRREMTRQLI